MKLINKNRTILAIIGSLLLIFVVSSGLLIWNYNVGKNKELDEVRLNNSKGDLSMFAIMLEQDDGTYEKSSSNTWPINGYKFDSSMSGCLDINGNKLDGILSYDPVNRMVVVDTGNTAYCYLYFSYSPDVTIELSDMTDTNENGKYGKVVDCGTTGSATFNPIYQRVEFGSITSPAKCTLKNVEVTYTTLKSEVETVNANQNYDNNGYRYSGKTPSNWVWFNGEKWRIIGSIPTKQSDGTTSNLVKIIRNSPISSYSYDAKATGFTGIWGSNTLYELLNTHYYAKDEESLNGQNHVGCYAYVYENSAGKLNCFYTEIGILSSSYYGKMAKNVYWNTGASSASVTASAAYADEISRQTVSGYIGLLSVSDYGYAENSSYHTEVIGDSTETNWLHNYGDEWTLTQYEDDTSIVLILDESGGASSYHTYTNLGALVRPVVFLDDSVYIISGDGTEGNPYQIGM